jgi:hypothetical protein
MIRDPFDGMSGDELDPQMAESDQLMALGMHETSGDDEEELDEEDESVEAVAGAVPAEDDEDKPDPSDDLDKDGLAELEEMEQQLLQEEPVLDFAMVEEE